ncbi:hypothetical protein [Streptomyces sp. KL116D]|uniref:hypothetical protein n=1 Tax=Streptomyces sp. KL116D TaxID=3045152 RepID=UPI0035567AA2
MSTQTCRECHRSTSEPVAVALEHVASGPGHIVYLCAVCQFALGLVPLDEHPADSLGFPALHGRRPETERQRG